MGRSARLSDSKSLKTIYILGILPRSGTNFLHDLLCLHPLCTGASSVHEDFLLAHSHHLKAFSDSVYQAWLPEWGIAESTQQQMEHALSRALVEFLHSMKAPKESPVGASVASDELVLVTKSPSVTNLSLLPMYPSVTPLILIRDGRAAVQSGMTSFGWDFEQSAEWFARSAREVLAALAKDPELLLVRYEDVVKEPAAQLARVLKHVGLDAAAVDTRQIEAMPARGSSEFVGADGVVDWSVRKAPSALQSLNRFDSWTDHQHATFNRLAGDELAALGYEPKPVPRMSAERRALGSSSSWRLALSRLLKRRGE